MQPLDQARQQQQWIALAQAGDKAAFARLFEHHQGRIFALALRLCQNPSLAEDATQEVFIRLWQKLDQYRGEAQFGTWLHRLAINVVLNFQKQQRWWHNSQPQQDLPIATESLPQQGIDRLLVKLPLQRRRVFVLIAIEGYQHDEAGQLLGISAGASKAHYHHARKQLQEWLQ